MECWDNYQDCDENVYENTRICIAKRIPDISLDTIELQTKERHIKAESSISEISLDAKDLLTNLEQYETLTSVTRESDGRNNDEENKDQRINWEDLPRKIKIIIYAISLMLVMLFIIDVIAAVVIVLSLPKSEDGGWSNWGSWGSCSESCGGGIKSRLRTCTNPRPSPFGKGCDGSSEQVVMCNKNACADGAWSYWGSWGSCSESCSGGIKSRLRTCTNPRPSPFGKGCDGSSEQVILCNKQTCDDHKVSFLAYGSTTVVSSSVLKFPTISFNSGNGYSSSTGRFTCKIPGIYNFAVTLTKPRRDINYISAYLQINGIYKLQLYTNPYDYGNYDYGSYSLSVTGNFYLNSNDYVDVYTVPNNFVNDYSTSFTGVLVIPDN